MKSGGTLLDRPVSTGVQDYETNKSLYPLTQAITKLEALAQTSGTIPRPSGKRFI
jgi:xanthine dehydrogenase/oxidase